MTPRNPVLMLTVEISDARAAMQSLIEARALPVLENDPTYPRELAALAWRLADAMAVERAARQRGRRP